MGKARFLTGMMLAFAFTLGSAWAEDTDFEVYRKYSPHERAVSVAASYNTQLFANPKARLPGLVQRLLKGIADPLEKVRILHDWEAITIAYDYASFFSGDIPDLTAYEVISRRNAVCDGYAKLFKELCDQAGIDCDIVTGHARGGYTSAEEEATLASNHAWNAVQIGEYWYLVDVTWDAGNTLPSGFTFDYRSSYLFLRPDLMIYSHYPDDPDWQLLDEPVDANQFRSMPSLDGNFLSFTGEPIPGLKPINHVNGFAEFDVPHPSDVAIMVYPDTSPTDDPEDQTKALNGGDWVIVEKQGETSHVTLALPKKGRYRLVFQASKEGGHGKGSTILTFQADQPAEHGFLIFDPKLIQAIGIPLEGNLLSNQVSKNFTISFKVPKSTEVFASVFPASEWGQSSVTFHNELLKVSRKKNVVTLTGAMTAPGDWVLSITTRLNTDGEWLAYQGSLLHVR